MAEHQAQDKMLQPLFAKLKESWGEISANHCGELCIEWEVLYVKGRENQQLVVSMCCRLIIFTTGTHHSQGRSPSPPENLHQYQLIFYWPAMYTDVLTYCNTCLTCQKTSAVHKRVPLYPLPLNCTPFKCIFIDLVGPLEKNQASYRYILVICDYTTRYPEAFPMHSITTTKVISTLVQVFNRVGFPVEILTDQGTNFTSCLMKQLHYKLGITSIQTMPFYPQMDGLVERFNQTLKKMLQKFVDDTGKVWDKWLLFLPFAYWEVPQASTGFSHFELMYRWWVQGPLDLLKKSWETPATGPAMVGIVQYVMQMRE